MAAAIATVPLLALVARRKGCTTVPVRRERTDWWHGGAVHTDDQAPVEWPTDRRSSNTRPARDNRFRRPEPSRVRRRPPSESSPFDRERTPRWSSPTCSLWTSCERLIARSRDACVEPKAVVWARSFETPGFRPKQARQARAPLRSLSARKQDFRLGIRVTYGRLRPAKERVKPWRWACVPGTSAARQRRRRPGRLRECLSVGDLERRPAGAGVCTGRRTQLKDRRAGARATADEADRDFGVADVGGGAGERRRADRP
jgi:hypothetical protein